MRTLIIVATIFLLFQGCIERYFPGAEDIQTGKLVVVGHLDNSSRVQTIWLSRTTSLEFPVFEPVTDCWVQVERSDGRTEDFWELNPGQYTYEPDGDFLKTGEVYRLVFITPAGERYESSFEKLYPAPDLQSLYYVMEDRETEDPDVTLEGFQFFLDFDIDKDSGRYLRWELTETYEMHNPDYEFTEMYDVDRRFKAIPRELAWRICWITLDIPEIYTMDLGSVEGERYLRMPLNYASNSTERLNFGYSLLVRQYALSEEAFWYWDELRKNMQSKGNLFDTQPSLTPSNICSVDNEHENIIGYFSVSGVKEKRIMVDDMSGITPYIDSNFCMPGAVPMSFGRLPQSELPYFLATIMIGETGKYGGVDEECINCTEYKGSSHFIPEFWNASETGK